MKIFTLNFITCAVKSCKNSPSAGFPLQIKDAEVEFVELEFQPQFIRNILSRIEWPELRSLAADVGMQVPPGFGDDENSDNKDKDMDIEGDATRAELEHKGEHSEESLKELHHLLMETQIMSGVLVCPVCAHRYEIKEGIANFLLPPHLV